MTTLMQAAQELIPEVFSPKYFCEEPLCLEVATNESKTVDEDGDIFYTLRCDNHVETDPAYKTAALSEHVSICRNCGADVSDPSNTNVDCLKGKC